MDANLFKVFLWKNWLFLKFYWISTSVISSAFFIILCIYLKTTFSVVTTPTTVYESKNIETLKLYFPGNDNDFIFYCPRNSFLEDLMEQVRTDLSLSTERIKSFNNASAMVLTLQANYKTNSFAVLFKEWPSVSSKTSLKYSIASSMTKVSSKTSFVNDDDILGIIDDDEYVRTGYLTLQHIIDSNFINLSKVKNAQVEVGVSPLPRITIESVNGQRITTFGLLFAIMFNVIVLSTGLIPLVEEKHDGIKEFLVLATPFNFLNGLTFFCIRFIAYIPFILACITIAYMYQAIGLIPLWYIIIHFLLYSSSILCYTFFISVCFNSVFNAKIGGFLLYIIPFIFSLVEGKISRFATFFFSTTTFLEGLEIFQIFTNKYRDYSSGDLLFHITKSKYSTFSILAILVCQCIFYIILYNYFSRLFPGRGGLKEPILFFLKRSFYNNICQDQNISNTEESNGIAINIQDLEKTYKTKNRIIKIADRLNMEIKDCSITVLLGHNGAGKTTTLNMILGCVPKDSGRITVCCERDVGFYRHLIGFCPQHSVFMQYMTCYQHLKFFAHLRGKHKEEADSLASELLTQLKLVDKANEYGKNLSGGMKRRLSLGIALSGETRVVILDEPSSGLDVESRRELWDILLKLRKSKAVLITTHHMEEAEVLGDTISILSNGKLIQSGSPLELKRKSGSGYILKLRTNENYHEQSTFDVIRDHIPTAKIINTIPPTVLISMPYKYKEKYTDVLEKLEIDRENLGISSIAVTDTSLEDVFLNCQGNDAVDSPGQCNEAVLNIPYRKLSNTIKWTRQMQAVFYKKMLFIRSQWIYSIVMFSLPFFAIGFAVFIINSLAFRARDESITLDLKQLPSGVLYLNVINSFKTIEDLLKNDVENSGIKTKELLFNSTIEEELLAIQSKNLYDFNEHTIGAIVVEGNKNNPRIRIFYSANIVHSSVILVNAVDNAILRYLGNVNATIETTNAPVQRVIDINPNSLEYFAAIVPIGFFFYMLYYVSLPFLENKSGFKSLQAIPRLTYWGSSVAFDMLLHSAICIACYIFQHCIMPITLYGNGCQVLLTFTYLFYGFCYLPILYCLTIGLRSLSPLLSYLFFMFIVSSVVPFITSNNLQSMQNFKTIILIMSLLPDFSLNHQLRVVNEIFFSHRLTQSQNYISNQQNQPTTFTFFIFAVLVFAIGQLFLIYFWDDIRIREYLKDFLACYSCSRNGRLNHSIDQEDETLVRKEKRNVEEICRANAEETYPLILYNLHKFYGRVHAVRGISIAVKRQECFGLLGVNGAGKTSTFQMITANLPISGGLIMIEGIDILKNENLYKYRFGYCPQGNCLNNFMTSYQTLKFMAMLRNVRLEDIHPEVMYWISHLDLSQYQNVPIRYYSGGTKRKLNAAIAMIGNPSLVLLDEPTTGVDPVSRRLLWKCIQDFLDRDKTVVLTSHSMDECERLCNRLAIMANGKLQCIGYIPDLKIQYGSGFTINLKLLSSCNESISSITTALQSEFSCELREHHAGMLTYFIKEKSMQWSEVFRRTERFMSSCDSLVQDYSINETNLEDIFLKFDKKYQNSHCYDETLELTEGQK